MQDDGAAGDRGLLSWEVLPTELQQEVWLWLPYPQIFRIGEVASTWHSALGDNRFWKVFNRR